MDNNGLFSCDLCGSTSYKLKPKLSCRLYLQNTQYNVIQCNKCHLARLFPLPDLLDFAVIYDNYDIKHKRLEVEKVRLNDVYPGKLETLIRYSEGNRLLDIGAGLGTFVYAAKNSGFDAVGIEYNIGQCETAKNVWGVKLINGLIEDHYTNIGKFDIIHLHHALEHVHSPKSILDIVYYLLNDNGICLIEVPNQFFSIRNEIKVLLTSQFKVPQNKLHHLTFFSVRTLKQYLHRADYQIIELNQFRQTTTAQGSFVKKLLRGTYKHIIDYFEFSGGHIIETYCKKLPMPPPKRVTFHIS